MIHATASALDKLEPLLKRLRTFTTLKEKSRGIFYYKSKAFLHFHEDAQGLFADVSINAVPEMGKISLFLLKHVVSTMT